MNLWEAFLQANFIEILFTLLDKTRNDCTGDIQCRTNLKNQLSIQHQISRDQYRAEIGGAEEKLIETDYAQDQYRRNFSIKTPHN